MKFSSFVRTRFFILTAVLIITIIFSPSISFALGCPAGDDKWFIITIKVAPESLPSGVTSESEVKFWVDREYTAFYLRNSTDIPLIINPPDPTKEYHERYSRPLTLKLISGKVYYCDVMAKPMKCEMNIHPNDLNAQPDVPEIYQAVMKGQVAKDDRPQDVKIPPSEPFQFNALYGDKQIIIRGIVSFSLNNKYDPKRGIKSKQICDGI